VITLVITTTTENVIKSLSYTEALIIRALAEKLVSDKTELVISQLTDEVQVSRSNAVTLLSKLSAAGLIETYSMGMRGMMIKVLNREAFNAIVEAVSV